MKTFQSPTVTELGSVQQLTLGGGFNGFLDGKYPTNTPSSKGLFSPDPVVTS